MSELAGEPTADHLAIARQHAGPMRRAIDHKQYDEALDNEAIRGTVIALIERAALGHRELTLETLDHTIEAMDRHGVTEPELEELWGGDLANMDPAQAEQVTRRLHVALEVIGTEIDLDSTGVNIEEKARIRRGLARGLIEVLAQAEEIDHGQLDENGLLQLAIEYRQKLFTAKTAPETTHGLYDLLEADPRELEDFLRKRYEHPKPK